MKLISNFLYLYRQYISERSIPFTRTITNLAKTTLAYLETLIHLFSRGFNLNFIKLNLLGAPNERRHQLFKKTAKNVYHFIHI